ncbi:MAG: nucleotidyltransferase substrate binding protein [Bacteroidota bacterium]|nr:nucleotidyltransferase substrate binding protein [Bacteroidota bacterium]
MTQQKTIANRDSAIKRFEFTVELAWKSLQMVLREEGIPCRSPKECLRKAYE